MFTFKWPDSFKLCFHLQDVIMCQSCAVLKLTMCNQQQSTDELHLGNVVYMRD